VEERVVVSTPRVQERVVVSAPRVTQRVVVPRVEERYEGSFRPYSFQFDVADEEEQTYHARQEQGDAAGEVTGIYSYVDPFGSLVTVNYRAGVEGYSETREVLPNFLDLQTTTTSSSTRRTFQPLDSFSRAGLAEPVSNVFTTTNSFPASNTFTNTNSFPASNAFTTTNSFPSTNIGRTSRTRFSRRKGSRPAFQKPQQKEVKGQERSKSGVAGNFGNIEEE